MERDFSWGLSSKKTNDEPKTSVVLRSCSSLSAMQWSFSNKGSSAQSQLLSFEAPQDVNKSRQTVHHDAYKSSQKSSLSSGVIQKNFNHEKQGGNHYAMSVYPMQQNGGNNQLNKIIPISISTNNNIFGHKDVHGSPQPILAPISLPPLKSSVVGTTDLRNATNFPAAPTQLTIFYAGSVNVYHDISPEKAHAIMLLAGNGSSSTTQVRTLFPSPLTNDGILGNQSHIALSISSPSPLSVASHSSSRPGGSFSSGNVLTLAKPVAPSTSPINHSEPSKLQSVMTNFIPAVSVPQARKASLARFFEKRKERMTMASPYSLSKKSPECSGTPGSEGLSFSLNSSGSCPPQAMN